MAMQFALQVTVHGEKVLASFLAPSIAVSPVLGHDRYGTGIPEFNGSAGIDAV